MLLHCRNHWPRCWGPLGCVRAEVSLVRIGDLSLLIAPGEIDPAYFLGRTASTADYGDRWGTWHFPAMPGVDRLMPGTHHAVIGSAQDYLSYMIPLADYVGWWNGDHPNHYEDFVTIGQRFGDDVGRAWRELLGEAGEGRAVRAQNDRVLDGVFEFPNVPGPAVALEQLARGGGEPDWCGFQEASGRRKMHRLLLRRRRNFFPPARGQRGGRASCGHHPPTLASSGRAT